MQPLKRTRYYTMNSWNLSTAPAYNLKIHNVIDRNLQDKVFEMMGSEDFYNEINDLVSDFNVSHNYQWQAGFNGRSGGYLVLYTGGRETKHITKDMFKTNHPSGVYISDRIGWCDLERAKKLNLIDKTITTRIYSQPGRNIEDNEVPAEVLKAFRQLAVNIVKTVESLAKNCTVEEEEYQVTKTRKVLSFQRTIQI